MSKRFRLEGWIPTVNWSEPRTIGVFKTEEAARAMQKNIMKQEGWRSRWHCFFVEEV
jgi:hypothetical protein